MIKHFIEHYMNKIHKYKKTYFLGCYTIDELHLFNPLKHVQSCFIFNTIRRHQMGTMGHWMTVYINIDSHNKVFLVRYLDSFALPVDMYDEYLEILEQVCWR